MTSAPSEKANDDKPFERGDESLSVPGIAGWLAPQLESPTFRLMIVAKEMDRLTSRQLAEFDLTYAEWRVLSRLSIHGELAVRQVADLASVDRAEVSRAARSLEKKGLTDRRHNPSGNPLLFVTAAGREQFERIGRVRNAFHASLIADLDEEERREFDRSIHKIAARLVQMGRARDLRAADSRRDRTDGGVEPS